MAFRAAAALSLLTLAAADQCKVKHNTTYANCWGDDLHGERADSFETCCQRCAEIPRCEVFMFDVWNVSGDAEPYCFFKYGCSELRHSETAVSGMLHRPSTEKTTAAPKTTRAPPTPRPTEKTTEAPKTTPAPTTAPVSYEELAEWCGGQCRERGYCCNDPSTGSNQMISCAQACVMRNLGPGRTVESMLSTSDGICNRGDDSGCSLFVNGERYDFCGSCNDLDDTCPHGVEGPDACDEGSSLVFGRSTQATTEAPPEQPRCTAPAPVAGIGAAGAQKRLNVSSWEDCCSSCAAPACSYVTSGKYSNAAKETWACFHFSEPADVSSAAHLYESGEFLTLRDTEETTCKDLGLEGCTASPVSMSPGPLPDPSASPSPAALGAVGAGVFLVTIPIGYFVTMKLGLGGK